MATEDDDKVCHSGTLNDPPGPGIKPEIASNEDFSKSLRSLADQIDNGSLDHASFATVNYLREVPGEGPMYMGTTFIIHSGAKGFPNNMALFQKLHEELAPQLRAVQDEMERLKSGEAPDPPEKRQIFRD